MASLSNTSNNSGATPPSTHPSKHSECHGCGKLFESRNAVFRHLRETNGACLSLDDKQDFLAYLASCNTKKTVILYGYLPTLVCIKSKDESYASDSREPLVNGDDAARFLLQGMGASSTSKINRSYGCQVRATDIVRQEEGTGVVCEVLSTKIPQLTCSEQDWIDNVEQKLSTMTTGEMKVFGRLTMSMKKFNAEMDVTHVRMEYLLPADFMFVGNTEKERRQFFETLPNFGLDLQGCYEYDRPSPETLNYLYKLKKLMQLFTTRIVDLDTSDPSAVMEKEFHLRKRNRNKNPSQRNNDNNSKSKQADNDKTDATNGKKSKDAASNGHKATSTASDGGNNNNKTGGVSRVLQRRRFHNFTPRVMAHEFLAYRRLDRFHHRATMRMDGDERPFLALSLAGDLFLTGQAVRVIGLWLALVRNLIDVEIVDCIFDEDYPHLIPTPPVPTFALYAAEASYMSWEGKTELILSPRKTDRYEAGWNNVATIQAVAEWQAHIRETNAMAWMEKGVDEDGRLVAEREWTQQVLEPWAERAREQLRDYRLWKASQLAVTESGAQNAILPPLSSADATVPELFEKVLFHLRKIDADGLWPSTTPGRQLVMVTTSDADTNNSLSVARMRARNNYSDRSSAYEFEQGQGGASGSFSVGAFPGEVHTQPKANALFPELMKHAFELDIALCPNREPSSTIAINRNAQFRPHTDSGAGAGQSLSLIVGLGTYVGGDLVVEGEKKDIRYKSLEFNGWTQRHWTMPFQGERYSLVFFTPKGCEGRRGIDLCR